MAVGQLQPFVWVYMRTEDESGGYSKEEKMQLLGTVLLSFQDDNIFESSQDSVAGQPSASSTRSKCRIVLMDPKWFYFETLFILNRTVSFEYGWLNESGEVLYTSGRVKAVVMSLKPTFTAQGTELEVILVSDFTAGPMENSSQGSSIMSRILNHRFVPATTYSLVQSGDLYSSSNPLNSAEVNAKVSAAKAARKKQLLEQNKGSGSFGRYDRKATSAEEQAAESAANKITAKDVLGPRTKYTSDVSPYDSIGELVAQLVGFHGMEYDIDATILAKSEIVVSGKTVAEFIRTDLVPAAISADGKSTGYKFWIRGNKAFFKCASAKQNVVRAYTYGNNNLPLFDADTASNASNGTLLRFDLEIRPNQNMNGPKAGLIAAAFDPQNKTFRGTNIAPATTESARGEIDRALNQSDADFEANYPEQEQEYLKSPRPYNLPHLQPAPLTEEKIIIDILQAKTSGPQYVSNVADREARARRVLAARRIRESKRQDAEVGNVVNADVSRKLVADTLVDEAKKSADKTTTTTGRLYVLPWPDDRTTALGRFLFQDASSRPMYRAKALVLGDPTLRIFDLVDVTIATPLGRHYGSGIYRISGLINKIDGGSFTTELELFTDGVANVNSSVAGSVREGYASPAMAQDAAAERSKGFDVNVNDMRDNK